MFDAFLSQIVVPPLPGKALKRMLPFRGDDGKSAVYFIVIFILIIHYFMLYISGIFEDEFIEERRQGLEAFVNR